MKNRHKISKLFSHAPNDLQAKKPEAINLIEETSQGQGIQIVPLTKKKSIKRTRTSINFIYRNDRNKNFLKKTPAMLSVRRT